MNATAYATDPERTIAHAVGARAAALQRGLEGDSASAHSTARGDLARLRRLRPGDLGADTDSWALTMDVLPDALMGRRDQPNAAERATQAALVLFALHAQSARGAIHVPDRSLGLAIRHLAEARDGDDPTGGAVMARFQSLGRAQTYGQLMTHLRGLIQLLRTEAIPLDYGALGADLYRWQQPDGPAIVRLRWGRGFHRRPPHDPHQETSTSPDESETTHVR
ncbi:MAG: type I-E CRISPR-associated protein Cse2/CasB [Tetrasphaera sp.]